MAKKKKGSKVTRTVKRARSTEALLRSKNISKEPRRKGGTADGGIGSKCRRHLSSICRDEAAISIAEGAYNRVVSIVGKLSDDTARAVCLAACSDYTFKSLVASATEMKQQGSASLGERDLTRIVAIRREFGDEKADAFRHDLLWAKGRK